MKTRLVFLVLLYALFSLPATLYAQSSAGISINPATTQEAADPGDELSSFINITNISPQEQTYYIVSRDVIGVRDGNAPVYAPSEQPKSGLELSSWMTLPAEPYVVAPGEEIRVPIKINVPENAPPGDHAAGVFASVQPPKLREIGAGVGYDVASIFIVKISGDRVVDAQIREFSTEKIIHSSTNVNFLVRLQNSGSDIVRPYGPLEVKNMFGRQVFSATFNESQSGVYPGTIRDYDALKWNDENPGFGRYQAVIALSYETDAGNRTINATVSFWILPMQIIGPAMIVLLVLLAASYLFVRLYIRRAIREVSGGTRTLVRKRRQGSQVSALMLVSIVMLTVTALFLIVLLILFA